MDVHKILQHEEPFFKFLGLKVLEVREGFAKLELEYKDELTRRGRVLHGGVIMSSIDYAGGIATMTVNNGVDQVTQELKVNFLEPMYKGPFTVEANVVRRGRTAVVVEIRFMDSEGRLGAIALGTWYILREKRVTGNREGEA
ncbi:MAG: PaaI family thioesterase [Candidatus Aramenus sp.]|jgi:uncharacterized protein (TIGR00369 family)|nr:PaaI family thioesterase [Candidatus Aramenus sp.]